LWGVVVGFADHGTDTLNVIRVYAVLFRLETNSPGVPFQIDAFQSCDSGPGVDVGFYCIGRPPDHTDDEFGQNKQLEFMTICRKVISL